MGIILMDGFENSQISAAVWGAVLDPPVSIVSPGYGDVGSARRSSQDIAGAALPTIVNTDTITVSFTMRVVTAATSPFMALCDVANNGGFAPSGSDAWLELSSAGAIGIRPSSSEKYWSADNTILVGQWYHLEWKHERGTDGAYSLKINGNTVLSGSGNNTGEAWNYLIFQGPDETDFDDVVVGHNITGDLGITKVYLFAPTSTGTGEWLGSDGNSTDNHLLVDDGDSASGDYVASTAGDDEVDLYGHAGTIVAGSTVHGIQAWAAANLDTPGVDNFSLVMESNGTEATTARTLGDGTAGWVQSNIQETDPDTATAWTVAKANAAQFGVRS